MEILIKVSQFFLSLSLLIIAHELGHFLFAKLFKTRVEKFYLFFNPWFSLFKIKKGETEYGLGWLPLGGYVKISGMIDESMDKEQMKLPPQPWEFRSKPVWQRLLIMIGGVLVNFILALFIYSMILFAFGMEYVPVKNAKYGFEFSPTAQKIGFQNGDRIIAVDGVEHETIADVVNHIIINNARQVTVERDGQRMELTVPSDFTAQFLAAKESFFATERIPWIVDSTIAGSPAEKAGLTDGDRIVAINDIPTPMGAAVREQLGINAGKEIALTVNRNGEEQVINLHVGDDGKLGFYPRHPRTILETKRHEYGFFASFPAGFKFGINILSNYVRSMKLIFSKEGVKQVGGFITIGSIFPATWNWVEFWTFTAFLSLILAFMNILPIPALDGGHVLFILYEIVTGRKPSDKFLENAQVVGMIILLGLLILANGNDIIRLFQR